MDLLERLNEFNIKNYENKDYTIEFDMDMQYNNKHINVSLVFMDYDSKNLRTFQFISDNLYFLKNNFDCIDANIIKPLQQYILEEYEINLENNNEEIYLFSIQFSGGLSEYIFGNCCLWFNSSFEDEHAIEVELKYWKVENIHII